MWFVQFEPKARKFYESHKKLVLSVLAFSVAFILTVNPQNLHGQVGDVLKIIGLIEAIVIVTFMILVAGAVVIRALFDVAVGLSLVIFLAQAYCASPVQTVDGNNALHTLIIFGLGYVAFDFVSKLYQGIRDFRKSLNDLEGGVYRLLIMLMFLVLAVIFVWDVYAVMSPIVQGFCIYQHPLPGAIK